MAPVHELADEIIGYLALAFQHSQDTGPEDLLKLLYLAPGKHIKSPVFSEKAVSDYGMKMRMKPGVKPEQSRLQVFRKSLMRICLSRQYLLVYLLLSPLGLVVCSYIAIFIETRKI